MALARGKAEQRARSGRTRASDRAVAVLADGQFPIFLGGDHSIAMGTVSGADRHCAAVGKQIFVLWVDAHGDYNTPETSPTGNLHGMSLALLCNEPEFNVAPSLASGAAR